jgi:hypothetical protein
MILSRAVCTSSSSSAARLTGNARHFAGKDFDKSVVDIIPHRHDACIVAHALLRMHCAGAKYTAQFVPDPAWYLLIREVAMSSTLSKSICVLHGTAYTLAEGVDFRPPALSFQRDLMQACLVMTVCCQDHSRWNCIMRSGACSRSDPRPVIR